MTGRGAAAMMSNVSVKGKLRPRGLCRSYAAALPPPPRYPRDVSAFAILTHISSISLHLAVRHMQLSFARKLCCSRRWTTPPCLPPSPPRRHNIHSTPLPAPAMLKAQVLRRHFSLYNRVPYARIARSAARDGHESVIIHRVRIGRPVFSRS
jgi:hypothetical protein